MERPNHSSRIERIRRYLPYLILGIAGVATLLMTIAFFTQYDNASNANYFKHGAVLPTVASILAGVTALLGSVFALLMPRGSMDSTSLPVPTASLVSAIGFLFCSIFLVLSVVRGDFDWMHILAAVLSLVSAVYCLAVAFGNRLGNGSRTWIVPLGFAPIFTAVFLCAIHYFDSSLEMNAPIKVMLLLGLLTAMVSFTGELRYLLGTPMPRAYFALLSWTVAAGSLSLIALPAASLAGVISGSDYVASSFVVFGCTLASSFRLNLLIYRTPDAPAVSETAEGETDRQETDA